MNELLYSSISEASTTSTDYSADNKDIKIRQGNSIKANGSNPATSKQTKRRPVGTSSSRQDYKGSEAQVLEFEDSQAVRDAVYRQWLLEKKAKIKEKRIMETRNKSLIQDEEAKAAAKKEQLKADAVKAYGKWKAKKDEDLVKKIKVKQQEKERKEEEEAKAKEKRQQVEQAIAAWQKKKDENLKNFLTSQARKREEEKEKLKQEAEKKSISKLGFDNWVERKKKILSETPRTQKSCDQEQKTSTQTQALAFEEWKKKKDKQMKLQKLTKKVEEKVHKRPWCPARSIGYDYLKSPQPLPNEKSKNNNVKSATSSLSTSQSSVTATLKSIKVCCQTLEYWCTCQK